MNKQPIVYKGSNLPGTNIKSKPWQTMKVIGFLCLISVQQVTAALPVSTPPAVQSKIKLAIEITGIVKDENGLAIPGVSIKVAGLNVGTQTDANGRYKIEDCSFSTTLILVFPATGSSCGT